MYDRQEISIAYTKIRKIVGIKELTQKNRQYESLAVLI